MLKLSLFEICEMFGVRRFIPSLAYSAQRLQVKGKTGLRVRRESLRWPHHHSNRVVDRLHNNASHIQPNISYSKLRQRGTTLLLYITNLYHFALERHWKSIESNNLRLLIS